MVYETKSLPVEWKGDLSGERLNPGVFVYKMEVSYFDRVTERTVILNGDVTLVR
jgi:hypothetical protein